MISTPVDLLAAISTHLGAFELPTIASVHVSASLSGAQIAVQLSSSGPATLAQGLLAWADTLTEITAGVWQVPRGDSVHLTVTGHLSEGIRVQVYGALAVTDLRLGAGLEPGTTTVPLATLRHLATPGQAIEPDQAVVEVPLS